MARASRIRLLTSSEVQVRPSLLKIARIFSITAPARCPLVTICCNAALASSRSGAARSSQRRLALAYVIIADNVRQDIEPNRTLEAGAQTACWRQHAWKCERPRNCDERRQEIAIRQGEERARAQD